MHLDGHGIDLPAHAGVDLDAVDRYHALHAAYGYWGLALLETIVRHADHTHLSYELFAPRDLGPVQEDLHVQPQATYILAVKNPARRPPPGLDAPDLEEARLPPELAHRFRGRRYAPADPPAFLDHEGTEFILIAAGDHARVGGERPDLAPEPRVLAELGLAPVGAGGRGGWDD